MKVLYVEDNPVDADLARRLLARQVDACSLDVVPTIQAALESLAGAPTYDAVLADLDLPDGSGLDVLAHIRGRGLPMAVIMLTGSGDEDAAVSALKTGADDYLIKHEDYLERLPLTLTAALARFRARSALRPHLLRVLYVEHNAFDIDLTRRHFAQHAPHIRLEAVGSAAEALSRLPSSAAEDSVFDVVLLDYRLHQVDALEVAKILRNERGLDLPLVLVTGQGSEAVAVQALHLGVDDYLTKHPGYLFELSAVLEKVHRQAELVREQTALRESEARIRLLLESTAEAIFGVGVDGRCTFVNRACLEMLGYREASELVGQPIHGLIHHTCGVGTPYPEEECPIQNAHRRNQEIHADDEVFWRRDGRPFPVEYWSHPMCRDGQVMGAVATFFDITERKHAEEALYRFRLALDSSVDNIFLIDRHEMRFVDVNASACQDLDYSRRELLAMGPHQIKPHYTREQLAAEFDHIIDGRVATGVIETIHQRKNGTAFPVEVFLRAFESQGRPMLIAIARDISERKKSEERLRFSSAVFESTRDGAMITDLEGRILAVNRAFTEITGYSEAEILGTNPRILQSGRQDRAFYQAMWASLLETGHWQGEIWNRRKSGDIYPEWLTLNTVSNPQGEATHYVGVFTDISQLKRSEDRLKHLAHYDPLTNLPNRLLVHSRLEHALEQAARRQYRVGVLFIDLDRFKKINDSLGHPAGDELLVAAAQRMRSRLRDEDTFARLGGDEFLVVLEDLQQPEDAAGVALDLIATLEQPFTLTEGACEVYMGASIGISLYPNDGAAAGELIRNADAAMYQAKEQGRSTYRFYTEALTRTAYERLELEAKLRRALEQGEFVLYYQPLVSVAGGHIIGAEALVRWQPPGEALAPPASFIPLAEDTGLIVPLGEWVLRTACAQVKLWLDAGSPPFMLAVNLATHQLKDREMVVQIRNALEFSGLPPRYLELEITESGLMEQGERAESVLQALKEIGVRLAIDDFGTGYSSLAYLKRFPIDKLKIDRSFVRDIPENRSDMEIAATIIAMARNLRLEVLAEGVETEAQRAFLQDQGCDSYQGYLCSPPIPADEFARQFLRLGGLADSAL